MPDAASASRFGVLYEVPSLHPRHSYPRSSASINTTFGFEVRVLATRGSTTFAPVSADIFRKARRFIGYYFINVVRYRPAAIRCLRIATLNGAFQKWVAQHPSPKERISLSPRMIQPERPRRFYRESAMRQ